MASASLLDDLARGLLEGTVVPWLGPGVHVEPPFPASPAALAAWLQARSPVPGRIRGNLWSVAQYIEQQRHRRTLDRLMGDAFSAEAAPSPVHRLVAALPRLPLVVDAWYDATFVRFLAARDRRVALLHGVDRTGQLERFFRCVAASGKAADADACDTLVYQPIGTAWPRPSFLVSDADWVEALTEIDIQTPIPPAIQLLRTGRRFLFLGQRFSTQLDRILARQVTKRAGRDHVAVLPETPTRNEARFLRTAGVQRVDATLSAFTDALVARLQASADVRGAGLLPLPLTPSLSPQSRESDKRQLP